ncbi:hypothetical protein HPB48_000759 [Haemaphysalis longicornis]|uniref:Transposase n=1 Tax=Haemaphysalis longicornis TaxID=44386 RepID=A0A9J6GKB0_HAELO|nr:hypothetical protein HPB48_000759 [Haemaphysalis longicornis]
MGNAHLKAGEVVVKMQSLYHEISQCVCQFGGSNETLSIDVSMVSYYGHQSCKMFICGKPTQVGYKIWPLDSSNVYLYANCLYCWRSEKNRHLSRSVL